MFKFLMILFAIVWQSYSWAACTAANPNAYIPENTPSLDFIPETTNKQVVKHTKTNLVWDRCPLGQVWNETTSSCTGNASLLSWQEALRAAVNANFNQYLGYDDWRVPNIKELASIIENCGHSPAINLDIFPLVVQYDTEGVAQPLFFWSSTSYALPDQAIYSWTVNFIQGTVETAYNGAYVPNDVAPPRYYLRLVRKGDNFDWLNPVISNTLDVDGNDQQIALQDGLIILRYLSMYGNLINGAFDSQNCSRCNDSTVRVYLDNLQINGTLDVDGNSQSDINDGLMIYRYLAGIRGNALIQNAIGAGCTRCTAADIENYLNSL